MHKDNKIHATDTLKKMAQEGKEVFKDTEGSVKGMSQALKDDAKQTKENMKDYVDRMRTDEDRGPAHA